MENIEQNREPRGNGKHRGKWETPRKREINGQNGKTPTIMA
jgi:hypothetical protein